MRFGPCTQSLLTGGSQSRVERFADKVAKIGSLFDLMQNSGQLCQACYLTRPSCELSRLAFVMTCRIFACKMKSPDGCPSSCRPSHDERF